MAHLTSILIATVVPAALCLWDRDTLKIEAAGAPGVAEAIVGHFDRYPDLYYEMRLNRVVREVEVAPNDLALYDDAAVALERLGRSDEAIEWMKKKRQAMSDRAEGPDLHHEYTFFANLGTFHVHRWLHEGAKRDDLGDLEGGRDLLQQALILNPDAHFGRERWQLMAIEFLIDPALEEDRLRGTLLPLERIPHLDQNALEAAGYADAVEGLTGLITLGSAWESVDILSALEWALVDRGDGHLAKLAALRIDELRELGRTSLVLDEAFPYAHEHAVMKEDLASIERFYPKARAAADARREKRNAYLLERLAQGEHPDTHPNIWEDWKGKPTPQLKISSGGFAAWSARHSEVVIGSLIGLLSGVVLWSIAKFIRRRRTKRAYA